MADERREALLAEYGEIRSDFRTLTDIRFKLLAVLPIASGAVAAFHGEIERSTGFALYVFGLVITLGLVSYNARNNQLYNELVGRAAEIERRIGLPDGAFANRPCPWLTLDFGLIRWKVEHSHAIELIYASSAALWLYGILQIAALATKTYWMRYLSLDPSQVLAIDGQARLTALIATVVIVFAFWRWINASVDNRDNQMRELAREVAQMAMRSSPAQLAADSSQFLKKCAQLSGHVKQTHMARSLQFYADHLTADGRPPYFQWEPDAVRAAQLVGLLTQLSPRWIHDCLTNRPGRLDPPEK